MICPLKDMQSTFDKIAGKINNQYEFINLIYNFIKIINDCIDT